jgi:hypothetical protein
MLNVTKVKLFKRDGASGLTTDNFIYAGDVSFVFTPTIVHGRAPQSFCWSTCLTELTFHGIALSSVFAKILDNKI